MGGIFFFADASLSSIKMNATSFVVMVMLKTGFILPSVAICFKWCESFDCKFVLFFRFKWSFILVALHAVPFESPAGMTFH